MNRGKACTWSEQRDARVFKAEMNKPEVPLTLEERKRFNEILRTEAKRTRWKGSIPFMSEADDA